MAFWLRAGLVIGAIYYLSPLRLGEAPSPARTAQAEAPGSTAGPVVAALSDSLRVRMVEAAAAEAGRSIGAGLQAAVAEAGRAPSRDTLTAHDRQPAWRGGAEREMR
ncbi:hypothetical protein [Methylobacterium aquaticum]|uniref:Uncharacterized protein n=1 Tax=Methylobacterium aquaticum TaxID=270351 RepID=A0A0J6S954_9HYPH|nr:hypothetical protein [Methylobacterium aquaticum]KMO30249.1 hypothetical protein VP06_22320 [Methylobacterium aquaticum]